MQEQNRRRQTLMQLDVSLTKKILIPSMIHLHEQELNRFCFLFARRNQQYNDTAGRAAACNIEDQLKNRCNVRLEFPPRGKDCNDYLRYMRKYRFS